MNDKSILRALSTPQPPEAHFQILIVDDEPRFRTAYQALLAEKNRQIDEACNGKEAIIKLGERNVDLVILDLKLPDISGIEIMEWLNHQDIDTTVIVFSADKSINSAIHALRHRAFEFLRKDCDPDNMLLAVERALNHRQREKEHTLISAQLKHSERLHRFLVDQSPDIIFNINPQGFFTFINIRIKKMLGYQPEDLIGKHYSLIVDPRDWTYAQYAFNERRIGQKATSNLEIRLQPNPVQKNNKKTKEITVILSTQGIYEATETGKNGAFLGTSGVARDISDRKRAEETITFQAFHDLLTKLPNRSLFMDRLEMAMVQANRRQEKLAVMFFDLDRFKLVNDTYGHAAGDQLLREFSTRIRQCLRNGDTLARQGGDEFTALIPSLQHSADAEVIAEKIIQELKKPFLVADTQFLATTSIGIAIYPDHSANAAEIIRCADMAMYQVKSQGKNGYASFLPHMQTTHRNRLSIENDLRAAVKSGNQFELYFQPQIDSMTGLAIGLEVLIRWHHPKEGLISPDIFIPIAEETGLIVAISDWMLQRACYLFASLRELGHGHLRLGVNLSPREFERSDFLDRVQKPLREFDISSESLDIEITESLLMKDVESIVEKVKHLRDTGFHISIDDFGTRYSSLNYLRRFSVNRIKIDQSFVRELGLSKDSYAIIQAIVGIAKNFKLQVMAEGVETEQQLAILRQLGCYEMQGYFFSRPLPFEKTIQFLQNSTTQTALHE